MIGEASGRPIFVGVEAKADEPFSELIREKPRIVTAGSNEAERVRRLGLAILSTDDRTILDPLRYQLFSAVAGTVIEAAHRGADHAVFFVHEFVSDATDPRKVEANARDLNSFVRVLGGNADFEMDPGRVEGPFELPGYEAVPARSAILIGKARVNLPTHAPRDSRGTTAS